MKKILCSMAVLVLSCLEPCQASSPILTITPSTSNLIVRSDGTTSVQYTVTNNASIALTGVTVNPYYQSTSSANSLALQNDSCSGVTLSAHATCQFGIVVQGANQASAFTIKPSVCANGGQACSTTTSSGLLTVAVDTITQVPFSYNQLRYFAVSHKNHSVADPEASFALLPINTATLQLGTPVTGLHFTNTHGYKGTVSVSLDGSRVYTVEQPNDDAGGVADIAVLSAGANSQLLKRIPLPGITHPGSFSTVLAPNGATLYVSSLTEDFETGKVFAVDLASGQLTTLQQGFRFPMGLAISPDGSRLYVCDIYGGLDESGGIWVVNTANLSLITVLNNTSFPDVFSELSQLAISPDNSKLYVLNSANVAAFLINSNGTYTYRTTINTDDIYKPTNLAFSSDSNYLYVTNDVRGSHLYQVDTQSNAVTSTETQNGGSMGVALPPDNSNAWLVSGFDSATVLDHVLNLPINSGTNTETVSIAGVLPEATTVPQRGAFIN